MFHYRLTHGRRFSSRTECLLSATKFIPAVPQRVRQQEHEADNPLLSLNVWQLLLDTESCNYSPSPQDSSASETSYYWSLSACHATAGSLFQVRSSFVSKTDCLFFIRCRLQTTVPFPTYFWRNTLCTDTLCLQYVPQTYVGRAAQSV